MSGGFGVVMKVMSIIVKVFMIIGEEVVVFFIEIKVNEIFVK